GHEGLASVEKGFSAAAAPIEFKVRYPGEPNRRRGLESVGRAYIWPATASLLIVDADYSLAAMEAATFWKTPNPDIRATAGASAALHSVASKYRIVYTSAEADSPSRFNKLRTWLRIVTRVQEPFPDGPLLARGLSGTFGTFWDIPQIIKTVGNTGAVR